MRTELLPVSFYDPIPLAPDQIGRAFSLVDSRPDQRLFASALPGGKMRLTLWRPAMDRETFTGTIRAFKQRTPFRPFTIVTASGGRHEIDHPEAIVERGGVAVFVGPGSVLVIFDYDGVSEVIGDLAGHEAGA